MYRGKKKVNKMLKKIEITKKNHSTKQLTRNDSVHDHFYGSNTDILMFIFFTTATILRIITYFTGTDVFFRLGTIPHT